ncbi:hypothetical protein [Burkholderia cepacia]|uniref:hypothetical protein n=1 Tax=Burkholderia cepacia TaxID=292 RepID=UPI00398F22B0
MKETHYRERGTCRPGTARRRSGGTVGRPAAALPRRNALAARFTENGTHCSPTSNKQALY